MAKILVFKLPAVMDLEKRGVLLAQADFSGKQKTT
jgi:hypothetical protein